MKDLRERRVLREPFLEPFLEFFLEFFLERRRPPLIRFLVAEFALPLESILYYILRFYFDEARLLFFPERLDLRVLLRL